MDSADKIMKSSIVAKPDFSLPWCDAIPDYMNKPSTVGYLYFLLGKSKGLVFVLLSATVGKTLGSSYVFYFTIFARLAVQRTVARQTVVEQHTCCQ